MLVVKILICTVCCVAMLVREVAHAYKMIVKFVWIVGNIYAQEIT